MSLIEKFRILSEGFVAHAEQKLIEASQPPKPLEPILLTMQQLARLSPQPDRLVAIHAAAGPLYEAARPLLAALADMSRQGDTEEVDSLHHWLLHEVALFQSICHDAGFRREATVSASYVLSHGPRRDTYPSPPAFSSAPESQVQKTNNRTPFKNEAEMMSNLSNALLALE